MLNFKAPDLVLIEYNNKKVYELGKIFKLTPLTYLYLFNSNKLKDEYSPSKTAKMLIIDNNGFDVKIRKILYRVI